MIPEITSPKEPVQPVQPLESNQSSMDAEAVSAPLLHGHSGGWNLRATFGGSLAGLLAALLGLLAAFGEFTKAATPTHVDRYYSFLTDVLVMIFLGFGALMTFLKRYSYSAIALNYVTSCLVILEALLAVGWAQQGFGRVVIDLPLLIDSAFCAGAAMISFGAVLGKATPAQVLWLLALEVPPYALTAQLVAGRWDTLDVGGSITIHAFGAVYGLAASLFLSQKGAGAGHPKNGASYASDMSAMLGTLFLFIYWPSFNGALAEGAQGLCIMNTVVALLGATLAAFAASSLYGNQLNMVHIQNATLAGGVAIGSSANLRLPPAATLAVGIAAGILSVFGYETVSPALEKRLGISDTCGVANLHGAPGILGGLASALFAWLFYTPANVPLMSHGKRQPLWQLAGLGTALALAALSGLAAGFVVSKVGVVEQEAEVAHMYDDAVFWHEVEDEE